METVNVTMEVPKETKDVIDALREVAKFAKSGKAWTEATELFDELSAAVGNAGLVPGEMASANRSDAAGYMVRELMDVLMPVEVVAEPATPPA